MNTRQTKDLDRQGDVYVDLVDTLPPDAIEQPRAKDGRVIVAGVDHFHYFDVGSKVTHFTTSDPFVSYVRIDADAVLVHSRPHDTREAIAYPPSIRKITQQRELAHTPEGWRERAVQD